MITISDKAAHWFKDEFSLQQGQGLRITVKGYGNTNKHEGMSICVWPDYPEQPIMEIEKLGILYYIEEVDDWFVEGYDLQITFNEQLSEPKYEFVEQ